MVSPSFTFSPPIHKSDCVLMHHGPLAWKQLITPTGNVFSEGCYLCRLGFPVLCFKSAGIQSC